MIRMKYHAPGTPPATLIAKPKGDSRAPVLTLIQYDGDAIFEEEFDTFEGLMRLKNEDEILKRRGRGSASAAAAVPIEAEEKA